MKKHKKQNFFIAIMLGSILLLGQPLLSIIAHESEIAPLHDKIIDIDD